MNRDRMNVEASRRHSVPEGLGRPQLFRLFDHAGGSLQLGAGGRWERRR